MNTNLIRLGLALGLACGLAAPAHALIISVANTTPVIVDGAPATSTVTLPAGGPISKVTVELDFIKCGDSFSSIPAACPGTNPAFPQDIQFVLSRGPSGPSVVLIAFDSLIDNDHPGGPLKLIFSDDGANPWGFVGGYSDANSPYKAVTSLAAFNGGDALGDWVLTIEDFAMDAPLGLSRFAVNVTVPDDRQIPEPTTLALLGLGIAGLACSRRKRRS